MRPGALLSLATAIALLSPAAALAAEANKAATLYTGRVEHAERQFGDVRFLLGAGQSAQWLEMYVGANLVAAYRDLLAQEVYASRDGNYFLAVTNTPGSTLAFALLDRKGQIVFSGAYHADVLRHCRQPESGERYWFDAATADVRFEEGVQATPAIARRYLAVKVKGCDGRDVLLGQVMQASPRNVAPQPPGGRLAGLRDLAPSSGK